MCFLNSGPDLRIKKLVNALGTISLPKKTVCNNLTGDTFVGFLQKVGFSVEFQPGLDFFLNIIYFLSLAKVVIQPQKVKLSILCFEKQFCHFHLLYNTKDFFVTIYLDKKFIFLN